MISYAQNHEDVLLARLFRGQARGLYVDVGAHHPIHSSVTRYFYGLGWRGVNVEPIASLHALHRAERPGDVSLNVGLSNRPGKLEFWEGKGNAAGLSTFSEAEVDKHRRAGFDFVRRAVPVTTLASLCEQHVGTRTIDFLSIDVEGHELEVLQGADFQRFRPRVVVIEATRPNTQIPAHGDWEDQLVGAGYSYGAFDGVNRYYVRAEDAAALLPLLATPVNVFDDYVSFETHCLRERVRALEAALAAAGRVCPGIGAGAPEVGAGAMEVARRLDALYRRFPRLMGAAGRLFLR
jgi:FkbM family methyltransferase